MIDVALLVLRVAFGLTVMAHGAQKVFGLWGGPGLGNFSAFVGSMGLKPGRLWGALGAGSEFLGGLLLALGLFAPLGALAVIAAMLAAMVLAHADNGFWNAQGGVEHPLGIAVVAAAVALAGPGALSLDAALGLSVPASVTVVAAAGVVFGSVVLTQQARSQRLATASEST